ncbi:MAG: 4-(cytidine 5'-diphospho)-2-C-methyl-D-erythritol kinase [Bacteroidales bacterium]|nr:4-(cytidine 5'-diphospho)-2-C-methyl-D-erythritol kinase [Bacteroidales bacterium]
MITRSVNCKINLGLRVLRKRADGYHDLETVFYPTDFFTDTLMLELGGKGFHFECHGVQDAGPDDDNLCVRAWRLLRDDFALDGVCLTLEKRIPTGAGLGGGSADAAFTLKMLAEAFALPLDSARLKHYAAQLGSDVPFFIDNTPMYATGRGEILTPVPLDLCNYRIEIVKPDFSISTKEAYAGVTPHIPDLDVKEIVQRPIAEWRGLLHNDFEDSVFQRFPVLAQLKSEMYAKGAVYAAMSGSGTAVFGIFL